MVIHSDPVRRGDHGPHPAELAAEVASDPAGVGAGEHHRVDRPAGQRPITPARARWPGRWASRCSWGTGGERVPVAAGAVGALGLGPAVVASCPDPVELVGGRRAELGRPHATVGVPGQALHVAVPVGPDVVAEGVAGPRRAVGVQAQDLPAEGVGVLGLVGVLAVAGAGEERPARPEPEPSAVVRGTPGGCRTAASPVAEPPVDVPHRDDPVVGVGGEVEEDPAVRGEGGRHRHAEQPALAGRRAEVDPRDPADEDASAGPVHAVDPRGLALGDQGVAVGQEGQPPRDVQPSGEHAAPPDRPGGRGRAEEGSGGAGGGDGSGAGGGGEQGTSIQHSGPLGSVRAIVPPTWSSRAVMDSDSVGGGRRGRRGRRGRGGRGGRGGRR